MNIFGKIVNENIFSDIWYQLTSKIFTESKLIQLVTLQPIDIYSTQTAIEIDNCNVELTIKSNAENIVQKRINSAKKFIFSPLKWQDNFLSYNFFVTVKAKADYQQVANFFNHHFGKQTYVLEENKYSIYIENFSILAQNSKAHILIPFYVDAKFWKFKRRIFGNAKFTGSLNFHNPKYTIVTRNLNYDLETNSKILKIINYFYKEEILEFLNSFLRYNFKEELFNARIAAQEQINEAQAQNPWINGVINDVELERITLDNDAIRAVFFAKGKLHLVR